MNKAQVTSFTKDVAGKVQEKTGKLVGSNDQQVKGLANEISGKLQTGAGDTEHSIKNLNKN